MPFLGNVLVKVSFTIKFLLVLESLWYTSTTRHADVYCQLIVRPDSEHDWHRSCHNLECEGKEFLDAKVVE